MGMTRKEARASIAGLSAQIERYADLAVRRGVAIQPGQELVVEGQVDCADFVRSLVRAGYAAGAGHVSVLWTDATVRRLEYEHMDVDYFATIPQWQREQLNTFATNGAAFLFVEGRDPYAFAGIDPQKPATRARAHEDQCDVYQEGLDFGRNAWSIVGAPTEAWATTVFPDLEAHEALYRLWELILAVSRADGPDPQAEWNRHIVTFKKNRRILNDYAFDRLRYRSSNGTDLVIGLAKGHIWDGGSSSTVDGVEYIPNIPTEEVFTSPDCNRADGIVYSVLPLVHAGQIVRDFWMRFEDGRVVEYDAAEGREVLQTIIEMDDRACRLGECALIAKDTPIRQSGILFYNTLYDENASCHLALGMGFPECVEDGVDLTRDELIQRGVNQSRTHVDFMIGADDLEITGITATGEEVPVFVDGLWAWDAE